MGNGNAPGNLTTGGDSLLVTLHGHKSNVTCLKYNTQGTLLASGGSDTEIVIWDLIAETGLFRLKGHKDGVTEVALFEKDYSMNTDTDLDMQQNTSTPTKIKTLKDGRKLVLNERGEEISKVKNTFLISVSRDNIMKVWDLQRQFCVQTIPGHRSEIWTTTISPDMKRLITGSTDRQIRMWNLETDPNTKKKEIEEEDSMNIIEEYHESQFESEPKTLMDIPKDWEGSSISIGDCLLDLQTHINELYDYFSSDDDTFIDINNTGGKY